jgi:hypothetical protein
VIFETSRVAPATSGGEYGVVDDGQVEELKRWAKGLSTDDRPEVKAAAKAITMLADDLAAARSQLLEERMIREALEAITAEDDGSSGELERDLRARLRGVLHPRFPRRA